jgi:hypothetical protein
MNKPCVAEGSCRAIPADISPSLELTAKGKEEQEQQNFFTFHIGRQRGACDRCRNKKVKDSLLLLRIRRLNVS